MHQSRRPHALSQSTKKMLSTQSSQRDSTVTPSLLAPGTRPRVLVLLASHNGEQWITEQLNSILTQSQVDVQINIRDDASSDQTRLRIKPFLENKPVRLTCGASPTGSASQNYFELIRENSADGFNFVAFSDQDDTWYVDKLFRACRHLTSGTHAGYSSATAAKWPDGKSKILRQGTRNTSSAFLFGGAGQGCTFVVTRDFYERFRSFVKCNSRLTRNIHYHDWAVYALACAWNLSWIFDQVPSVTYRQHSQNDTGARTSVSGVLKRLTLIRQQWYANQLRAIAALCASANPTDVLISQWNSILFADDSWNRRLRIARYCMTGGRRSIPENIILIVAALLGYL